MECYEILGGRRLKGTVRGHGAKNSVLPILCATLLAAGVSVIHNCPRLSDVDASIAILRHLGCRVEREGNHGDRGRRGPGPLRRARGTDAGDALLGDLSGGHPGPELAGRT